MNSLVEAIETPCQAQRLQMISGTLCTGCDRFSNESVNFTEDGDLKMLIAVNITMLTRTSEEYRSQGCRPSKSILLACSDIATVRAVQDLRNPPTKLPEEPQDTRGEPPAPLRRAHPHLAARTRARPAPPAVPRSTPRALLENLHAPQRQNVRRIVLLIEIHRLTALERGHDSGGEVPRARRAAVWVMVAVDVDPAGEGEGANGRRSRGVRQARRGARRRVELQKVARRAVRGSAVVVVRHLLGHPELLALGVVVVVVRSRGLVVVDCCDQTHLYCPSGLRALPRER